MVTKQSVERSGYHRWWVSQYRHACRLDQSIDVPSYTLGCFFGACATIGLGNLLGRRKTIFVGTSIMIIGAILQCTSFSIGQLIPARLITGFGNGRSLAYGLLREP